MLKFKQGQVVVNGKRYLYCCRCTIDITSLVQVELDGLLFCPKCASKKFYKSQGYKLIPQNVADRNKGKFDNKAVIQSLDDSGQDRKTTSNIYGMRVQVTDEMPDVSGGGVNPAMRRSYNHWFSHYSELYDLAKEIPVKEVSSVQTENQNYEAMLDSNLRELGIISPANITPEIPCDPPRYDGDDYSLPDEAGGVPDPDNIPRWLFVDNQWVRNPESLT